MEKKVCGVICGVILISSLCFRFLCSMILCSLFGWVVEVRLNEAIACETPENWNVKNNI